MKLSSAFEPCLIEKGLTMGWTREQIVLYIENIRPDGSVKAASGRLRIDQREGLKVVVERIERGEVAAVLVGSVSFAKGGEKN